MIRNTRKALVLLLFLGLTLAVSAQTVRVQGQEIPYVLQEGRQWVWRSDLARVFPGFPDGKGLVDLAELVADPNARIMRRDGLIVSVRFYNQTMAAFYEENRPPQRDPDRAAVLATPESTEMSRFPFRPLMDSVVHHSNLARAEHGLPPLTPHVILETAATGHSKEMAEMDYFSHTSPTEGRHTPTERMRLAGCQANRTAENIAFYEGYSPEVLGAKCVEDWMNSPGHRKNLLNPHYTHIGIGVARVGRKYYLTQNFSSQP